MSDFENFQQYIIENIREYLPDDFKTATCSIQIVTKTNNEKLTGLTIRPEGSTIAPVIYLDNYFEKFEKEGYPIAAVMLDIRKVIEETGRVPDFDNVAENYRNFDYVKDKVVVSLVNTEKNKELLENAAHTEKMDLSVIYKVIISEKDIEAASITVKNEHLAEWGVTTEELHSIAMENSKKMRPVKVASMGEIMASEFGVPADMIPSVPPEADMYVVTNNNKLQGASAILYSDALSEISEKVGDKDLYIIPSSIHEVIVINAEMHNPTSLSGMVRDINGAVVSANEVLSDNVYKFDSVTKELSVAQDNSIIEQELSNEESLSEQPIKRGKSR